MSRLIVDVREPHEYAEGHVTGAVNVPSGKFFLDELPEELRYLPKDQAMVLYCRSGQRAGTCANLLKDKGFSNVINGTNQSEVEMHHTNKSVENL